MGNNQIVQHGNFMLIDVPKDAKSFLIKGYWLFYEHNFDRLGLGEDEMIDLPPGQWQIVGIASSLTEEQWKGIVEKDTDFPNLPGLYKYYESGSLKDIQVSATAQAKTSGLSLLAAHGKKPSTTLVILKNNL